MRKCRTPSPSKPSCGGRRDCGCAGGVDRAVDAGDPIAWLPGELKIAGKINLEQFGGLRVCFVFLATLGDERCRRIMEGLRPLLGNLQGSARGRQSAVIPVFICGDGLPDPREDPLLGGVEVLLDRDGALTRTLGLFADGRATVRAIATDEALVVREVTRSRRSKTSSPESA